MSPFHSEKKDRFLWEQFAHRGFRALWFSTWFSTVVMSMQTAAVAWLVYKLTHSPIKLSLATALRLGPTLVLILVGGVLSDKFGRRGMLIVGQGIQFVGTFLFAVSIKFMDPTFVTLCLLNLFGGIATALTLPSRRALVPELSIRHLQGVALVTMAQNVSWLIGPPTVGLILEHHGKFFCFALQAVLMLPAFLMLFQIPKSKKSHLERDFWQDLRRGIEFGWQNTHLRWLLALMAVIGTISIGGIHTLTPMLAKDVLHVNAVGYGLMMAALTLGMILGTLLILRFRRVSKGHWIFCAVFVGSFAFLGITLARSLSLSLTALFLYGIIAAMFESSSLSLTQSIAPEGLRGRMTSLYLLIYLGGGFLGNLWMGALSSHLGPVTTALIMLPFVPLSAVIVLRFHPALWRHP